MVAFLAISACAAYADDTCMLGSGRRYGTFAMQSDGTGHFTIDPIIAGKQERMLVDTGGVYSSLLASTVKDLGLSTSESVHERVIDVNGHKSENITTVPTVLLGSARFREVRMVVDDDDDPLIVNSKMQGILAPDILSAMDVDLNFAAGWMSLFDGNHCENGVPYWSQTWADMPFSNDEAGHIVVTVNLDGKEIPAIIDTGSPTTVMSLPEAHSVFGLEPDSPGVKPRGTLHKSNDPDQKTYSFIFGSLKMGGMEIKNPEIVLLPDNMRRQDQKGLPDIIIGLRQLSKLHLYIAFKTHTLYFTEASIGSDIVMVNMELVNPPANQAGDASGTTPATH